MSKVAPTPNPDEPADQAIPKLVELYGDKIHALGLRLCGAVEDADDILQETFLSAFRHWDQFEGRAKPSTWLFTIASRACRRRHRKRAGEPAHIHSIDALLPAGTDSLPDIDATLGHPAESVERRELEALVHEAVGRLPMRFRLPLVLKDLADFSLAEIAAILDLKEATVKTRVHRARLQLRKELSDALPNRRLPPPDHSREVCLDLLASKQEALDRGVDFPLADEDLCDRCRAVFASLDLLKDTCAFLGRGSVPPEVRRQLDQRIARLSAQ